MNIHKRLLLPLTALVLLAACSAPAAETPESTAPEPTAEPTTESTTEPTAADSTPTATAAASDPAADPWSVNAVEHRAEIGEEFTYDCPPADEDRIDTVWGTDIFTDDSSVCTAAVHAGVITVDEGGEVTIEMAPGEESYEASEQNGVQSLEYGPWGGSFVVIDD